MNTPPYTITLYIHPDQGPISPIRLNMLEVDALIVRLPISVNRDEARMKEIIQRIKKQFPLVDPQGRHHELAHLISRLNHLSLFDGAVLRLPGSIEGDQPPAPDEAGIDEYRRLAQDVLKLKTQLEVFKRANDALSVLVPGLQAQNQQLTEALEEASTEIKQLRKQVEEAQEQLKAAQGKLLKGSRRPGDARSR